MKSQRIAQPGRRVLVWLRTLIQSDQNVASSIRGRGKLRTQVAFGPFRHWQDQKARRAVQQAPPRYQKTLSERARDIDTAFYCIGPHRGVQPQLRAVKSVEGSTKHIPRRPRTGAQHNPAQLRVHRQQAQRKAGPGNGCHASVSATTRATRVLDPASSSGSRRKRWRSAKAATSRTWARDTLGSSRSAA